MCFTFSHRGHPTDITVLPSLRESRTKIAQRDLRVQDPMPTVGPLWDAAQSFITSRRLSGHPVKVHAPLIYYCHICDTRFTEQQEFKSHLRSKHSYRVCSHCGDFGFTPEHRDLFTNHLTSKHPEVVRDNVSAKPVGVQSCSELLNCSQKTFESSSFSDELRSLY